MFIQYIICVFLSVVLLCLPPAASAQTTETDLLSAAQQAFNDGFSNVAVRYLKDFLNKYPMSPDLPTAKLLLGECDFLQGNYGPALEEFQQLSRQKDKRDEILFWRGETYLKEDRFTDARRDYRSVIKDFPRSPYVPQAYYSLGWSFFQQKDFERAKTAFLSLVAGFPNHQLSQDALLKIAQCDYNAGRLGDAVKGFQDFLLKYPKSGHRCEVDFDIAESLYYLGSFEPALGFYQKTLDSPCDDHLKLAAYTAEGWIYKKLNKFHEAREAFNKAEAFSKAKGLSDGEVVLGRANLAYSRRDYSEALSLFTDFINNYPRESNWTQGYLGRADVLFLMKKYNEARRDYLQLVDSKDPDIFEKARFGLGWTELKLGQLPEAISRFQEVLDKTGDPQVRADALVQMGDVYQESGQWDDAAQMYERVKKMYPHEGFMDYVFYRQAIAFLKSGKVSASFDDFKSLQDRFPKSKYLDDIDYYFGIISFKRGDWSQSARMMDAYLKALSRPSEFTPDANYILALSYLNLNRTQEALRYFQKILRLYPNNIDIAKNADIGIAKCRFNLGQTGEAVKRFKLVVYKYPKTDAQFDALLWLAQYYLKNADGHTAVEYYKAIIDNFPDSHQIDQVHYELGQAYELLGSSDQALEQYKDISTADKSLAGKTRLAMAGIIAKDFGTDRAAAAYENIIVSWPDYAGEAYLKLGRLYRDGQDYEKEMQVYQQALAAKQGVIDRARIQFNLADTLELMGRTDEAIAEYLKIPQSYPARRSWVVKAYLRIAKIYEGDHDWEGARVTYQKIIQLNPPEAAYAQERLDWIKNNAGKMRDD
ncbi:MAG: tetratricopeptide repeat protein [Candidatus Omnitrophica bacterium]|nr:tetratricopeptide repeat protein [Candidatus Omnitrophota bacterium]MDE2009404.1 tetratricopeptide repeat protein [Candidatus Omnitrophota bacterium]MDE2214188.1 tetratricopeptide repeat protein [Candidatus Omnitrophota bacterium]